MLFQVIQKFARTRPPTDATLGIQPLNTVNKIVDDLLDRFALSHRRRDPVSTFSQGMTKRAGIVRSLLNKPSLWILDEPFSGLDPAGQKLLFEDQVDAAPLVSRCVRLDLDTHNLEVYMARRARKIARTEGLDGRPLEAYVELVRANKCNQIGRAHV